MDITEVFVIEKKMIDLTYPIESKNIIVKKGLEKSKKSNIRQVLTNGYSQSLTVRGLNWSRLNKSINSL